MRRNRKCPICGKNDKHIIKKYSLVNYDSVKGIFDEQCIAECEDCGAIYNEGVEFDKLSEYYADYTCDSAIRKMTADESVLNNRMADFVEHHLDTPKNAYILDVGCSYGWLIDLLISRGYSNVEGMDTDISLIEKMREAGYHVCSGSAFGNHPHNGEMNYDLIILKMVLEHLEEPYSVIKNVGEWLNPGGILLIEVPDASLYEKTAFFPGYFQTVGLEHINYFSHITLTNMMIGWKAIAMESTDNNGIYPVLRMAFVKEKDTIREHFFANYDREPVINSYEKPSEIGEQILSKIDALMDEQCLVWGTSAFTRGLLANTRLKELNIKCFVDRNPELQKLTLIGKHIISPEEVGAYSDCIIVIPGKTSKESIIRDIQKMGYNNRIVCLSE